MKTNRIQKHICDFIINQITWWSDSHDINSSTHMSDLESSCDELNSIDDVLTESQTRELENYLSDLLVFIRNLK